MKNIDFIENGMEFSEVREILNAVILHINQQKERTLSYNDLSDLPCINGVELTSDTTSNELNLTLSQLSNANEIEGVCSKFAEATAAKVAKELLKSKLDSDFSGLTELKYNFKENMLLALRDKETSYYTTVNDLLLYLKYLILKDKTFGKLVEIQGTPPEEAIIAPPEEKEPYEKEKND